MISYFRKPNFVFFGTPEFAAIILQKLTDAGMPPAAVVCNPDRPVGRKEIITPPPTKLLAQKYNIPILQPEVLSISNYQLPISKPDFAVVAAYAKIIPAEIIAAFPRSVVGVHPSLLPKHRGSSPIQTAILEGDKETGVTLYILDEKVDHGPILAQRELEFPISNFQFPTLLEKLAELGGNLLVETLPKFLAGEIKPRPQNEAEATYTKKFATADAFVAESDLNEAVNGASSEKVAAIERRIRALNPEPGVWTMKNGKRIKLLEAEIQNGKLALKIIQEEGGRPKSL